MPGGDFHPWFFAVVAVWILVCGVGVVLFKKIMYSAISMVFCFLGVAFAYALLNSPLVAIIQILVYAGAIMVLFLFVIMLLNLGNDFQPDLRGTLWKVVAGGASLVMLALLARLFAQAPNPLGSVAGPNAVAQQVADQGVVGVIGIPMFLDYGVILQATGLLLLVAVVGAVVLAKRRI